MGTLFIDSLWWLDCLYALNSRLATKVTIAGGAIYVACDSGLLGSGEQGSQALEKAKAAIPPAVEEWMKYLGLEVKIGCADSWLWRGPKITQKCRAHAWALRSGVHSFSSHVQSPGIVSDVIVTINHITQPLLWGLFYSFEANIKHGAKRNQLKYIFTIQPSFYLCSKFWGK